MEESREKIIEKLPECGFMVRRRDAVDQIKFVINMKLAGKLSNIGFDRDPKWIKTLNNLCDC